MSFASNDIARRLPDGSPASQATPVVSMNGQGVRFQGSARQAAAKLSTPYFDGMTPSCVNSVIRS
jgi:hypothetical protein